MIRIDSISKQNGHQLLFVEAAAALNRGEKIGLVGPNGAGKTTLFRMITGREEPDEGQVTVERGTTIGYFSQTMQGVQEINSVPTTFGAGDRFNGLQAGITVPLWYKPFSAKVKAAGIQQNIAKANAEAYHKTLFTNYRSLLDELEKYNRSVDFYEQQAVPEANYIIGQSGLSYKAGDMDYLDFVLSLNRALSIRQNYLDALNSYMQTLINLEYITGKTL